MGYMMISRALLLALSCAYASALTPLSAVGDDNDCALYLSGPGRTSAFDYSLNLLKGNFGYEGQHTCITYDAVNQAYLEARNRITVSQPKGDWKPEDFASVGELVLDISINLARKYGLTYEEIEKGLPLIDTSRTLIREVCPPVFSHVECRPGKYRRMDGLCNNIEHPTWGATNAPFQRLIGPLFADGINSPRIAHTGRDLPLSRVVSRTMHPDEGFHDHAGTIMVIAWGQFMDHDYTLTGTPLDPLNRNDPEECCKRPPHLKHPYCNEIRVPDDDYFYRLFGVKCIDFVRAFPSPRPGCRLGSRIPFNTLTGAIDGNTVYGVTEKFARKLRTGYGGLLRMNPVFKEYGLKDLLPLKLDIPDEGCTRPNKNMYCFEGGEIRVNEQLILTVMHTLMAREHNRIAEGLAAVNPHWDDETLYQEARRINIAEIQHITYNEFLPILLGKDVMQKFGLVLEKEGYWDGYDPNVNPDVIASFASAAYRFGHSLLPTAVERWSKAHKFIASKRLSDLIRRPYDLYRAGVLDEYVMGLMNQVAQAMDDSITQEVTNHLFKKVGARFGMDLVSFNMQRGREFGIPGYMEFRKFCGLSGADSFQDLFGTMSNETVLKYETIFEHPIDVDLWSGGVSERPLPGSMLGPTFACIIATQFSYSRRGDRFWFELPNQPSSFTPEQLTEIRKSRMARIICDNTDIIDTVQLYPMVLPDHELNPRVPCKSGIIPQMDFSKWAEPAPFHGGAKQFITDAIIPIKSEDTDCDKEIVEPASKIENINENANSTDKYDDDIVSAKQNTTGNSKTQQIAANENTDSALTNCKENFTDCTETKSKSNKINDDVTILKYNINPEKTKGHAKNSIKRKKRSLNIYTENAKSAKSVPIVNYVTSHSPKDIELIERNTGNVIRGAALADFNIETLHNNVNTKKNDKENSKDDSREDISESNSQENSEENNKENIDDIHQRKPYNLNENSDEIREHKVLERLPKGSEESEESNERYNDKSIQNKNVPYTTSFTDGNESREVDKSDLLVHPDDSNERGEKYYNTDDTRSTYKKPVNDSRESDERENYEHQEKSSFKNRPTSPENSKNDFKSDSRPSTDNSDESEEDTIIIMTKKNRKPFGSGRDGFSSEIKEQGSTTGIPIKIQDVDLRDFSYERIQVNADGVVEPAKYELDNYDEISPLTTIKPNKDQHNSNEQYEKSIEEDDSPLSGEINEGSNQPIHLNDGEVKPVVEIDRDSRESSEERSKEAIVVDLPNEDSSLETFLGVKEIQSEEQKDKIISSSKQEETGDVKQEFERIPLNYHHDKKQKEQESKDISSTQAESTPVSDSEEATRNDGTLDTFQPHGPRYDENLNIKFSDLTIKLPEIKLPEDILAYAYETPEHTKKNKDKDQGKSRLFHYDDEGEDNSGNAKKSNENNSDHDDDDDDHDPGYHYDYYGYQKKNDALEKRKKDDEEDNEEDEDLYEKFVRERFGKRGSYDKRSEKLQMRPVKENAKLYQTLQQVLKQTEDIQKQADKSDDPNAGYMWTLEYGHAL